MTPTFANHLIHKGPFPCKGHQTVSGEIHREMTAEQIAWMKEHKPSYFTGDLFKDLIHLPQHLRHV